MLSSTFKVTWKWGNDRDVSWKSFSGPASSISNSSRTRDVGVASGGTQFCWTSGLSTRMTSQFVGESSFRCRLLLNAQDAGRWVWFLNVAHELFLVKKLKQQTMEETSQGEATTDTTPEGGDTVFMIVLGVVALVLMVLLSLALFFMYRRMTRAERARRRRKEKIRARAIEASAKLREELNEDMKRPFDARSGSSGSSRSGSSGKASSVHFSDADVVWDPTSSSRTVLRTNLSDSEKGSKWRTSTKVVLQGSRRTSHDVAKEYLARRGLQIRSRRSPNASAEEFGVGLDHSKDGRRRQPNDHRSDGLDRSRASRHHSNKTDSSDHFRENVSRQHFRSQDEPSSSSIEDPSHRLQPADPVSSPTDASGVTKVAETKSAEPEQDLDQASTIDEEDVDDASSYASSDGSSSFSDS